MRGRGVEGGREDSGGKRRGQEGEERVARETGTKVTQVQATDHDDPNEGTNARLIYSLEKNVIDEATGRPIFTVDGKEGVISTSICCLDREKAQRYTIQVVATDGGGLKGGGRQRHAPQVPPAGVGAGGGEHLTPDHPLGELGVVDQDLNNQFSFRVVPESGRGWQLFRVGAGGVGGLLWARQPLDYENPAHRVGFRFRVEVTDRGEDGWHFPHNTDSTWVSLHLQDANDNPPTFTSAHAHLSLPEDTPPGSYLASFPAHDDDGGGDGKVDYSVAPDTDPGGLFSVSEAGVVQLARELDREAAEVHRVLVEAVDRGTPPRTATATLLVNVTDVNDNPPYLSEPRQVRVPENVGPREVARVHLSDLDVWGQGHGPPFSLHLDPRAPSDVKEAVVVSFNREGDSGRGEGVVSTSRPLDREVTPVLLVPLVVGDAGSLSATVTLTVHVTDMNDNPMAPASRHVTVWVLQPQSEVVPLGRVFVQDPDEGDQSSKTYRWRGEPHPLVALSQATGNLALHPGAARDSLDLTFSVSDPSQGQVGVRANVTVQIRSLGRQQVSRAIPLTLAAAPGEVVRERRQEGQSPFSIMSRLEDVVREWAAGEDTRTPKDTQAKRALWKNRNRAQDRLSEAVGVRIISVGVGVCTEATETPTAAENPQTREREREAKKLPSHHAGLVTYSVVEAGERAVVGPRVALLNICGCDVVEDKQDNTSQHRQYSDSYHNYHNPYQHSGEPDPQHSFSAPPGVRHPGPGLRHYHNHHHSFHAAHHTCAQDTCLNGGRCLPTQTGFRCICPHGTQGARCKVLSRQFKPPEGNPEGDEGGGKTDKGGGEGGGVGGAVWLPPVPSCSRVHFSLEILARTQDATVLYSGPEEDEEDEVVKDELESLEGLERDLLLLELRGGRPVLEVNLGGGAVRLVPPLSVADGKWHRLDITWMDEVVEVMVDLCVGGLLDLPTPSCPHPHPRLTPMSECRRRARLPVGGGRLNTGHPLLLGGRAAHRHAHGHFKHTHSFRGCVRNLRINGELMDLAGGAVPSTTGCPDPSCATAGVPCGPHGRCRGAGTCLQCECQAGWGGSACTTPTIPTTFQPNSFVKLALSFTPFAYSTSIHLRP
ncbi:hypothetical protein O3P69_014833 [Scylla paramamosain]|uniref:Neural-cadherin n=1 Tax=Scylla paramamosain TaxID=85552 RepID=A0AAW0TYA9_SCYPA